MVVQKARPPCSIVHIVKKLRFIYIICMISGTRPNSFVPNTSSSFIFRRLCAK